jgi:hypothetical protein
MARWYVAECENQSIHRSYGDWVAGTKETTLNRSATAMSWLHRRFFVFGYFRRMESPVGSHGQRWQVKIF